MFETIGGPKKNHGGVMPTHQAQPMLAEAARLTAPCVEHRPETPLGRTSNSFEHNKWHLRDSNPAGMAD